MSYVVDAKEKIDLYWKGYFQTMHLEVNTFLIPDLCDIVQEYVRCFPEVIPESPTRISYGYVDASRHRMGPWIFYNINIEERYTLGNYKENLKEGLWVDHYRGKVICTGNYYDDLKEGVWRSLYSDGEVYTETTYHEEFKHGPCADYYGTGSIRVKGEYRDDTKSGTWTYYNRQGDIRYIKEFSNGEVIRVTEMKPKICVIC